MKKIYLLLFNICAFASFSQAPKLINYQGVARKASGLPITTPVKIKFEIFPSISGSTSVFSETQSTNTNSLGIFSTQIGKTSILSLNWDFGPYFLEVSIDTTNTGSSFIIVGRQQMVSVPYALYAQEAGSAPDPTVTYSNNILNVGSNSVNIPSGAVYSAGPDIAITSGSIINTAPDKPVTLAPAGNVLINGSYPNFTVGAVPQALGITSNTITLSNGGGSVVLPSTSNTPNTLVSGTGAATVTTSGTNTFNIAVAPVNISGSGATSVSGTYPNFLISSPTFSAPQSPTITGTGIANVNPSSGNNFTVNVPPPSLSYAGGNVLTIVQGTSSSAVTIPAGVTPTLTGTGIANVSPTSGNNFTVNVPPSTLSYTGNVLTIVQGTSTSAVTIPAGVTPTITGQGIATVTPVSGNNFTVNVASPNLVGAGITTVTGSYPSYTINTPAPPTLLPAWLLSGNAATIDGSHFIGTTDNIPFNIRVNNQKSGRIDPLLSNTFFGYWSGRDNTSGTQNTAYGINSLAKNTVGVKNSVFGTAAMESNISGNNNTAQGAFALFSNTTGSTNVGIGSEAGFNNSTGSGNVFLGHKAGFSETGSNKLYIANNANNPPLIFGDFTSARVGLGTTFPDTRLHVAGTNSTTIINSFSASPETGIKIHNNDLTNNNHGSLIFGTNASNGGQYESAKILGVNVNHTAGAFAGDLVFMTRNPGNLNEVVRMTSNGNVGIGVTAPAVKLHVNNTSGQVGLQVDGNDGSYSSIYVNAINATASPGFGYLQGGILKGGHWVNAAGTWNLDVNGATRQTVLSNGRVGINETAPTATLSINGNIKIADGTQGIGKILTSDAAGTASWAPAPPKIAFNAGSSAVSNQAVPASSLTTVIFGPGNNFFNDGGGYNTGTNQFTPPSPGIYNISTYISIQGSVGANLQVWISGPGPWLARSVGSIPGSAGTTIVHLTATVNTAITPGPWTVQVYSSAALTILPYDSGFSGFKVY